MAPPLPVTPAPVPWPSPLTPSLFTVPVPKTPIPPESPPSPTTPLPVAPPLPLTPAPVEPPVPCTPYPEPNPVPTKPFALLPVAVAEIVPLAPTGATTGAVGLPAAYASLTVPKTVVDATGTVLPISNALSLIKTFEPSRQAIMCRLPGITGEPSVDKVPT